MKVTFIGDGHNDPSSITAYGHTFPLNKEVDVEVDEVVARKLHGNSHFEVEGDPIEGERDEEREALLAEAEAKGVKIHPRTKTENIRAKIDE